MLNTQKRKIALCGDTVRQNEVSSYRFISKESNDEIKQNITLQAWRLSERQTLNKNLTVAAEGFGSILVPYDPITAQMTGTLPASYSLYDFSSSCVIILL